MKHNTFRQWSTILLTLWGCFFVHSCRAGAPRHLFPALREITRAPAVQIGIRPAIRAERAAFAVNGPCWIGDQSFEEGFEGEALPTEKGVRIGDRDYAEPVVRVRVLRDGDLELNKIRYHGHLLVCKDGKGVTLVNEVDLEDYLAGVVGKEMHLSQNREALKAQVIAARTYALCETRNERLRKVKGEKFDLYDDERSQVYGGQEKETDFAVGLVKDTRGMFLTWEENLVNTFYSSTCGGATDAAWKVLEEGGQIPPLAGTTCGYCESSPHYRWEVRVPAKEIGAKLFENEPTVRVKEIRILEALPGGHAMKIGVKVEGAEKERVLHGNKEFRRRLKLKSTLFDSIEKGEKEWVIRGRGNGHGAGMCQYGAYGMAKEGKSAIEILEYYFPGAKVKKLY